MEWYIYKTTTNQYTICKVPSGSYQIYVSGPTTFAACAAQLKAWGIPGW